MAKNIKELNTRVDELAYQFQQGINEVKKLFDTSTMGHTVGPSTSVESELSKRFKKFEYDINFSLNKIKNDVKELQAKLDTIVNNTEKLTINHNSNMLLFHGIKEDNSNIYEVVQHLMLSKLNINSEKRDFNHCYRLGQKMDGKKPRPIVVDFTTRWMRDTVFYSKKKLKGTKLLITEMLTLKNLNVYKIIREIKESTCWTKNGRVICLHNGKKMVIDTEEDAITLKMEIQGGQNSGEVE